MATGIENFTAGLKQSRPENWLTLLGAFSASYGVGSLAFIALPFLMSPVIIGLGLTTTQAGLLGTTEFASIMLGSLAISPFMNRVPRRWIALAGTIAAIVLNVICATVHPLSYELALVLRALAGASCGLAMAAGNSTVSNARDPERMSAHMSIGYVLMVVIACLIFPWAAKSWGYAGVYLALAAIMLMLCPFLLHLPQHAPAEVGQLKTDNHLVSNVSSISAAAILFGLLIFATRDMAGWTFVERLGTEAGYTADQTGLLLSVQALFGIVGPLAAAFLGSRRGLVLPLVAGIFATGTPYIFMLLFPGSKIAFTISALFLAATYFFTQAYLIALAAELDRKGRIVAAAGGFISGGSAVGPALGGYLMDHAGYAGTSAAMFSMVVLTVFLVLVAIGGKGRASSHAGAARPSPAS